MSPFPDRSSFGKDRERSRFGKDRDEDREPSSRGKPPEAPKPGAQSGSRLVRVRKSGNGASHEVGHPAPAWMVNYADLMTELVCFFVILYALSASLDKNVREVRTQVDALLKQENIQGQVEMKKDGVMVSLQEGEHLNFFESGQAILSAEGLGILDKIVPIILKSKGEVIIEGHTDSVPVKNIQNGIASNWELSTARATNVVRYLIDQKKFPADRLAAIGYGENRPVAPNDTPEGRAKNRRVVFFIKTS